MLTTACRAAPTNGSTASSSTTDQRGGADAVPQIAQRTRAGHPVLFVGLDGADWTLLDDYVNRGSMPNLARLVREGASGVLETIRPPLSPIVWTTMMTGVSPLEHGILDFVQFDQASGAKEPITSTLRRAPAIWNMATYGGKRAAVLGLWATYPAEAINGVIVSDRLFTFLFKESAPPPGVVYPAAREQWAHDGLDRAQQSVDEAMLKSYLPWLTAADYHQYEDSNDPYAHPASALRRILIETRVYDELGRDLFQRDRPDLTTIYLQGTDSIGHVFAPYAPPRQASVPDAEYQKYSQVPELYFRMIDDRLGEYRRLAERAQAVLMLASDHGFFWKDGRPSTLSSNAMTTAAKWHRNEGMYVIWGPGIAPTPGHVAHGSVQQVCATLLSLLGLPPGRDVDGEALPGVATPPAARADYFAFYRPPAAVPSTSASGAVDQDTLAKLRSLGYIGDGGPSSSRTANATRTPGSYNNEGVFLKEHGKTTEAMQAFEKALELDANLASALWNLSDLLFARQNDLDRSDRLLVAAFTHELPEGQKLLIGRAIGYQRAGQPDRSLKLVNAALQAKPKDAELWLFRGRYRVDAGDCAGATGDFQKAEQLAAPNAPSYASEGLAWLCAGNRPAARKALARSLEIDPRQPKVREFLKGLERTP